MKKLLVLFFIFNFLTVFSQKKSEVDSSEICFPYHVGQQILLDLNDYDKVKKLLVLSENEIDTLNLIIKKKDGVIKFS